MNNQLEQAQKLHDLHRSGNPLVLVNAWDAGSAQIIQGAGGAKLLPPAAGL
ncbi:hypothetical protein ACFTAO_47065 [Paenibacillus rhizoplanae]